MVYHLVLLEQAKINLADLPFIPVHGTAEDMNLIKSDSIDCIVSADTIEHIPDVYKATEEMLRVLKPGGSLIINTPNIASIKKRLEEDVIDLKRGKVKMIEIVTKKVAPAASNKKDDSSDDSSDESALGSMNVKDAVDLVKETLNTPLLRSWKESETRKKVSDAIKRQLAAIDKEREEMANRKKEEENGSQE